LLEDKEWPSTRGAWASPINNLLSSHHAQEKVLRDKQGFAEDILEWKFKVSPELKVQLQAAHHREDA